MKKDRFAKLKLVLAPAKGSKAMHDASRNPQKFMKDNKNMSIKNLKGVAS